MAYIQNIADSYISGAVSLYNADNMAIMAQYPDKYFDLAVVDPPYGIGAGNANFQSGTRKKKSSFFRTLDWDNATPPPQNIGRNCSAYPKIKSCGAGII